MRPGISIVDAIKELTEVRRRVEIERGTAKRDGSPAAVTLRHRTDALTLAIQSLEDDTVGWSR